MTTEGDTRVVRNIGQSVHRYEDKAATGKPTYIMPVGSDTTVPTHVAEVVCPAHPDKLRDVTVEVRGVPEPEPESEEDAEVGEDGDGSEDETEPDDDAQPEPQPQDRMIPGAADHRHNYDEQDICTHEGCGRRRGDPARQR